MLFRSNRDSVKLPEEQKDKLMALLNSIINKNMKSIQAAEAEQEYKLNHYAVVWSFFGLSAYLVVSVSVAMFWYLAKNKKKGDENHA